MTAPFQPDNRHCHVILLRDRGTEVLLVTEAGRFSLPSVTVPRGARFAENLAAAMQRTWGVELVCLFAPGTDSTPDPGAEIWYPVAEHLRSFQEPRTPTTWRQAAWLSEGCFSEANDFAALRRVLAGDGSEIPDPERGPFGHFGWFQELYSWVEGAIAPRGLRLTGGFSQLNASATFSLIRFESEGRAVWFKAVGAPNEREYSVTQNLSRVFPQFLAPLLAARSDCNGWLTEEVEGATLASATNIEAWASATACLAKLQIASVDQASSLHNIGLRDLNANILLGVLDPFFEAISGLMDEQAVVIPSALSKKQLSLLEKRVEHSLRRLAANDVPDSLGHLDLNPENIIVGPERCAFLDWAEGYSGLPFLSFQYLLEHLRRTLGSTPAFERALIMRYVEEWKSLVSPSTITQAISVTPLVAVYAYAVASDAWRRRERSCDTKVAGYLRSLARRMYREAERLDIADDNAVAGGSCLFLLTRDCTRPLD